MMRFQTSCRISLFVFLHHSHDFPAKLRRRDFGIRFFFFFALFVDASFAHTGRENSL
jgi:hypothetical protein